ncbi:hypothetical protein R5R35_005148 [Gryllus longicercus]|uniref:Heparanase n=1 Tax=Gryllus longicercus TaxID=2509291 RepID=A0AAN9VBY2_9ORTH
MPYFVSKFVGLFVVCYITLYLRGLKENITESPTINIDRLTAVKDVSDKFLSVALDTELIRNGQIYCIKSSSFLHKTSLLTPAFLRIGGNSADRLLFDEHGLQSNKVSISDSPKSDQNLYDECKTDTDNFTMSGSLWTSINTFSEASKLQIVFDLNVLLRNHDKWDSSNALDLLQFSSQFDHNIVWQLGNEPNSFRHKFGTYVSPTQLGIDFQELRSLLNQFSQFKNSMIIGPDVTRPHHVGEDAIHYLRDFLLSVGNTTINAVTWHQYYLNRRDATLQDFINPSTLNVLKEQILAVNEVVDKHLPGIPVWLSETGSAYGGGAPGLSNTYVAGFLWLDKLGTAARHGIDVVVRQSLYGGSYALLDTQTLEPLPDWWLSIIYKKLVGTTVLDLEQFVSSNGNLRIYAHCSSKEEMFSKGSIVTLFALNLLNFTSHFKLQSNRSLNSAHISAYILTGCKTLTSRYICLNEDPLMLKSDESLPYFKPFNLSLHSPIYMPPHSLGFWTLHGVNVEACIADKYNVVVT